MKKATIELETLACPSCMQKIEAAVKSLDGIKEDSVKVMFNASKVKTEFDDGAITIGEIEKAIEKVGYTVIKSKVR